ncbi:MAG: hypothetical protein Q8Q54_09925 [Methylococcales bacterium]|nr:hypothetical protein [Methylococcales bacterium]MDP3839227.1 hypothetical protein [Methylococcales bacterium]
MATVIFYEKPECANNKRQKRLLIEDLESCPRSASSNVCSHD